jgi:hypothetical protein
MKMENGRKKSHFVEKLWLVVKFITLLPKFEHA